MKGSPKENLVKDSIKGMIANEVKSLDTQYPYVSEREEESLAVVLDIKNKKNLQEALDLFIKPDILEGDNKYFLEEFDTKVRAQRRSYFKKLSNTVVMNLKRFEFDYSNF